MASKPRPSTRTSSNSSRRIRLTSNSNPISSRNTSNSLLIVPLLLLLPISRAPLSSLLHRLPDLSRTPLSHTSLLPITHQLPPPLLLLGTILLRQMGKHRHNFSMIPSFIQMRSVEPFDFSVIFSDVFVLLSLLKGIA